MTATELDREYGPRQAVNDFPIEFVRLMALLKFFPMFLADVNPLIEFADPHPAPASLEGHR